MARRGWGQAGGTPCQIQVPAEADGSQQASEVLTRSGDAPEHDCRGDKGSHREEHAYTEHPRPLELRMPQPPQKVAQSADHGQQHPSRALRDVAQSLRSACQVLKRREVK